VCGSAGFCCFSPMSPVMMGYVFKAGVVIVRLPCQFLRRTFKNIKLIHFCHTTAPRNLSPVSMF
jgi:hypothetical protein